MCALLKVQCIFFLPSLLLLVASNFVTVTVLGKKKKSDKHIISPQSLQSYIRTHRGHLSF